MRSQTVKFARLRAGRWGSGAWSFAVDTRRFRATRRAGAVIV